MRILCTALAIGVVFLFSYVVSAQGLIEGTFGRLKDRPDYLGFFMPDGGELTPGVMMARQDGAYMMFHADQVPEIEEGDTGYFVLQPHFYYGSVEKVINEADLVYLKVDAVKLDMSFKRYMIDWGMPSGMMGKEYIAVPGKSKITPEGNLEISYRLLPVVKTSGRFRVQDFLYTKKVAKGIYPLFGRATDDSGIVFLGYLKVESEDSASAIAAFYI
jgi:hypothetical protein